MLSPPLLVVGLDGATLDLIGPWARAGELPMLARLLEAGSWGALRSTVPAATFPAWTSLVTGVNPGRHGVLDFTERVPGTSRLRFVNGSHRRTPAFWRLAAEAGRRAVVVTVPATYPPEELPGGVMVSGFDTPLTAAIDGSFVAPRGRWAAIRRRVGRVPFADFQEVRPGRGWHERGLASLLDGIERRTRLAEHLIESERADLCMVVFGESDTVSHHFWRFHDPASPRWQASPWGDAVRRVYVALDDALGRLMRALGDDPNVAVVSDHGSGGAGDRGLYLNRLLEGRGLLGFRDHGPGRLATRLRATALGVVPFRMQASLLRRFGGMAGRLEGATRFGAIAWDRTVAYSEELDYHPSVWLNLEGREPLGLVPRADYESTRERVVAALEQWRYDDGQPVLAAVWRREQLYRGPYVDRAPDLLLEPALRQGYSPSFLRSPGPGPSIRHLEAREFGAGKGAGMNGAHRPDGLYAFAGPGVRPLGDSGCRSIVDVAPTLLALAGVAVPRDLDGVPLDTVLRAPVLHSEQPVGERGEPPSDFDAAEEEAVARRLAALGYLDAGTLES